MKNKKLTILITVNILLIISVVIMSIRNKSKSSEFSTLKHKHTVEAADSSVVVSEPIKPDNHPTRLTFLPNQSDDLVKDFSSGKIYHLPSPNVSSNTSVEEAMLKRRSRRGYKRDELSAMELSQILWAAYGVTKPLNDQGDGLKTSPSADGKYPLSIYFMVGNVANLPIGFYKYEPAGHKISRISYGDKRSKAFIAADNQVMIKEAPLILVYTGNPDKLWGDDEMIKQRWTNMEVGHSAQNVYLQATALNLGTCAVGWFFEDQMKDVLEIPENEQLLYLMPVGQTIKK